MYKNLDALYYTFEIQIELVLDIFAGQSKFRCHGVRRSSWIESLIHSGSL